MQLGGGVEPYPMLRMSFTVKHYLRQICAHYLTEAALLHYHGILLCMFNILTFFCL